MALPGVPCAFLDPRVPDVEVSLPSTVRRAGGSSSFGVVTFGGVDLELNDSHRDFLPNYFATTGAGIEDELQLRSGHTVRLGRVGGRDATGHCFAVEAGSRRLLGTAPPKVSPHTLARWLNNLHITSTRSGPKVPPAAGRWSEGRPPHAVRAPHALRPARARRRPARVSQEQADAGG